MNCNTTHYRANSSSVPGDPTAIRRLREVVDRIGDVDAQQALKRVELQVMPVTVPDGAMSVPDAPPASADNARFQTGALAATSAASPAASPGVATVQASDPILSDPVQAFREEIIAALMDAMLDHSRGVGINADEWLHIGARRNNNRPAVLPADGEAPTVQIRARGRDLTAFLAGQISREEAHQRMEVKVF